MSWTINALGSRLPAATREDAEIAAQVMADNFQEPVTVEGPGGYRKKFNPVDPSTATPGGWF